MEVLLVILLLLWILGFVGHIGGDLIHLLLIFALIGVIYSFIVGRRNI